MNGRPARDAWALRARARGLGLTLALALVLGRAEAAVEVNDANQAELETLKGIGPGLSEAILAGRRQRLFRDWPDFMARLSGIGPVRAGKLSDAGLTVAGQPWPRPGAASDVRP